VTCLMLELEETNSSVEKYPEGQGDCPAKHMEELCAAEGGRSAGGKNDLVKKTEVKGEILEQVGRKERAGRHESRLGRCKGQKKAKCVEGWQLYPDRRNTEGKRKQGDGDRGKNNGAKESKRSWQGDRTRCLAHGT